MSEETSFYKQIDGVQYSRRLLDWADEAVAGRLISKSRLQVVVPPCQSGPDTNGRHRIRHTAARRLKRHAPKRR